MLTTKKHICKLHAQIITQDITAIEESRTIKLTVLAYIYYKHIWDRLGTLPYEHYKNYNI